MYFNIKQCLNYFMQPHQCTIQYGNNKRIFFHGNRLIIFPLFLIGKIRLVYVLFGISPRIWNGLRTHTEVLLYLVFSAFTSRPTNVIDISKIKNKIKRSLDESLASHEKTDVTSGGIKCISSQHILAVSRRDTSLGTCTH
jgi:hypothetical protein